MHVSTAVLDVYSILFVIRCANKFVHSRLRLQLQTSLAKVPSTRLLPVANHPAIVRRARGDRVRVRATRRFNGTPPCANNHQAGIVCIEGRALHYARHHPGSWSWMMIVDDDVYVNLPNLWKMLSELSQRNAAAPVLYGVPGCGKEPLSCDQPKRPSYLGLCGGAGYVMTRQTLYRLVGDGNVSAWMRYWMHLGKWVLNHTGGWWSDITASCVAQRAGLHIRRDGHDRMHAWSLRGTSKASVNVSSLVASFQRGGVSYHYVGKFGMPSMKKMHEAALLARNPRR